MKHTFQILFSKISFILLSIGLSFISCDVEELAEKEESAVEEINEATEDNPETEEETEPETIELTSSSPLVSEPSIESADLTMAQQVLKLVNGERSKRGLSLVVLNDALTKSAIAHSVDMDKNNYFSHTGLNGSSFSERTQKAGYKGSPRGENIGNGYRNANDVHNGWMSSNGHRNNILNPNVTDMGVGESNRKWTQIFGTTN